MKHKNKTICLWRNGKVRWIDQTNLLINKNTPRGEPAALYERKPYDGKRLLGDGELLGKIKEGEFVVSSCLMTKERHAAIIGLNLPISNKLFHNGAVLTRFDRPFFVSKRAT